MIRERVRESVVGEPWVPPDDRGQLVLVAAGVIAIALVAVLLAYAQLGYVGVADAEPTTTGSDEDALDTLERAAFVAATDEQGAANWTDRDAVVANVTAAFDDRAATVETASLESGIVHEVEHNETAAEAVAAERCPGGDGREFGACEAIDGVVVQERAGDAHVVAIAIDVRTVTEDGEFEGTYAIDAERGERMDPVP